MNPFTLLKEDHKKVKALFKEYEAAGDKAFKKKQDLSDEIFKELEVHTTVEEEIFYPKIKETADKEGQELVLEGYEEHLIVKRLMEELKGMNVHDEKYDPKFKVLMENVKHHIEEEEGEMFPKAKKGLDGEAEELGEEMEVKKEELS
jgi:Hemerythrin HHE cation binding domain.